MRQFIETSHDWFVVPQKVVAFKQVGDGVTKVLTVDGTEFDVDMGINDFVIALNRQLNNYGTD